MADVPLVVISEFSQSERRITPSWTISQLKGKLETVTGVPPGSQRLSLKPTAGAEAIAIEAANEDDTHLSNFPLAPYAELHVSQNTWLYSLSFVSCYFALLYGTVQFIPTYIRRQLFFSLLSLPVRHSSQVQVPRFRQLNGAAAELALEKVARGGRAGEAVDVEVLRSKTQGDPSHSSF